MMSWLLPGALVMGAVLLVITVRARRTDRERAALLLWGGSLVCIGLVISLAQGIIHPYYAVALAPPLGALVGIGTMGLWQRRETLGRSYRPGRRPRRHGGRGATSSSAAPRTGSPPCVRSSRWSARSASWPSSPSRCCAPCPKLAIAARGRRSVSVPHWPRRCSRRVATAATPHSGAIPSVTPTRGRRLRRPRWRLPGRPRRLPGRWLPPGLRRRWVPRWRQLPGGAGGGSPAAASRRHRTGTGDGRLPRRRRLRSAAGGRFRRGAGGGFGGAAVRAGS